MKLLSNATLTDLRWQRALAAKQKLDESFASELETRGGDSGEADGPRSIYVPYFGTPSLFQELLRSTTTSMLVLPYRWTERLTLPPTNPGNLFNILFQRLADRCHSIYLQNVVKGTQTCLLCW